MDFTPMAQPLATADMAVHGVRQAELEVQHRRVQRNVVAALAARQVSA